MMKPFFLTFGLFSLSGSLALGAPLIEEFGDLKVDWSNQSIQFTGHAAASSAQDWKTAERLATEVAREAVSKAAEALFLERQAVVDQKQLEAQTSLTKQRLKTAAYSRRNEYGSDGSLRVNLEAKMPRLFVLEGLNSERPVLAKDGPTGVVFRVKGTAKPQAVYVLKEPTAGVLMSPGQMNGPAYQKGLMARWFKAPLTPDEQKKSAGANPLVLDVTMEKDGEFKVLKEDWEKAAQQALPLLKEAKVAIVVE
jgi:hypothetical protein